MCAYLKKIALPLLESLLGQLVFFEKEKKSYYFLRVWMSNSTQVLSLLLWLCVIIIITICVPCAISVFNVGCATIINNNQVKWWLWWWQTCKFIQIFSKLSSHRSHHQKKYIQYFINITNTFLCSFHFHCECSSSLTFVA